MSKTLKTTLAACALLAAIGLPAQAETMYLFAGDLAVDAAHGSGIHRYRFDSEDPAKLTPAPSPGQEGDIWGESLGKSYHGQRMNSVAVAPNGDVYAVCGALGSVYRFDGQSGAYKGEVIRGLDKPDGLTFGPDGNLYVTNNTAVLRYSPEGKVLPGTEQIGAVFASGPLQAAAGLTFGPDGDLYVTSQGTWSVLRYDGQHGTFKGVFCSADLRSPSELAFGADGHLYVASTAGAGFKAGEGYVAKFDGATGKALGRLSPEASGALGLVFGPKNALFVSDYWDGRITHYDATTGQRHGVAAKNAPGSSFRYLALAGEETGAKPRLKPWRIALPLTAAVKPVSTKPSPLTLGPATVKGWQNGLKPRGTVGPLLTLADQKKAAYSIVLATNATTMDQKAAAVLAWTLKEMTGAEFSIVREGAGAKLGAKAISIGRTALFNAAQLPEAKLDLGEEGYAIATKGANLFLWGGSVRGAIYAVYALLEEDLGCRWYASGPEGARFPRSTKLSFKPMLRHFTPALTIRDPFYVEATNGEWSLRNRTNSPHAVVPIEYGGHAAHAIFVHSYEVLVPATQYFSTHPEYFALVNGARQPTQLDLSNPDVLRILVENVKKQLRAAPGSKFISVSPNDGRGYCECPACSAIDKAEATVEGSKTGSLIDFCNKVADAIAPEFPDVKVTTLAYLDTFMPPKTIRPHKNVVIQLCTDSHAWKYQFCEVTESEKFQTAMKAWNDINADLYVWDYTADFVHNMVPMPNFPVVVKNIQFYIEHGAKGVMLEGEHGTLVGPENSPMRNWVWAKQLWDPSLDTRGLMKDFIYGYYGDAAVPIWEYNDMLWQIWAKAHAIPHKPGVTKPGEHPLIVDAPCSMPPDWEVLSPEFLTKSSAFFERAEALAKDPETLRRVRVAGLSILYVKLGQGLGYIEELGGYKAGSWVKITDPARKAEDKVRQEALLKEFLSITDAYGVTNISGYNSTKTLTDKWRAILDYDTSKTTAFKLNSVWKFKIDPQKNGVEQGWHSVAFPDGGWSDMRNDRKSGWESQGFPDYMGEAWYRQKITIPADFKRMSNLWLYFGSIDSESEIYINGTKAFDHTMASTGLSKGDIWQTPFVFDPTPWLKFGEENSIAIKVSSYGGIRGIWAPVYLVSGDEKLDIKQIASAAVMSG
jgi:streptogramin lyase